MLKQIIIAVAGAIAAQMTAATLTFTQADRAEPAHYETQPAAIRLAVMPGTAQDLFAAPALVSNVVPFLGAPQMADGK